MRGLRPRPLTVHDAAVFLHPRMLGGQLSHAQANPSPCAYDWHVATRAPQAIRNELIRIAHEGLGVQEFARRAARILRRAVPFDGAAIVACDPATALPIDKWVENSVTGSDGLRLMDIELHEADVNKVSDLALSGRRAASMSEATGGRLDRSLRYRELMRPRGFGDELRVACIGRSYMWGVIVMHRDLGRRNFGAREVELVSSLSGEFAEAFQRAGLERALRRRMSSLVTASQHCCSSTRKTAP